jgi:hypothetical protein
MLGTAALRRSFDFTAAIVNTPGSRSRRTAAQPEHSRPFNRFF